MTYLANRDYNLEVLKGNVSGSTMVVISGHDNDLTTTRTTVHPSGTTLNINQSVIDATPAVVKVSSTSGNDDVAGSGLLTATLSGLDSSGDAQTETITMTGQTEVTSANTYSAVTGMRGLTWGATTWNEGVVWVGTGTVTAGVPAVKHCSMDINTNNEMTAYYVVPNAKTLYLREIELMVSTSSKDVEFFLEQSSNGTNWFTEAIFGMEPGEFESPLLAIPGIVAGQHVRVEAVSSAASTQVSVRLIGELVDD